ncbi:hypothetical protein GF354_04465, partial [Candidatus Peregrinibacteria bacterium]|nr:hypothetical protein [Candidatus Peregrinibacteria bacterium]
MGEINLPEVFDEAKIRNDLAKYKKNGDNLKLYLNGLTLRFHAKEQMKSIRKITELLDIGREYLDAVYENQKAQGKVNRITLEEQVE